MANGSASRLSRAFMRDAQILILDEPTSALDAEAEYDLFARIKQLAEGRMAIFISHRFSTTRRADRILVLENAKLIEQGTHAELMVLNGRYAELFNLQAESYLEPLPAAEFAPAPGPDWMRSLSLVPATSPSRSSTGFVRGDADFWSSVPCREPGQRFRQLGDETRVIGLEAWFQVERLDFEHAGGAMRFGIEPADQVARGAGLAA